MTRWGLIMAFIFTAGYGYCQQDSALKHRADKLMNGHMPEAINLYRQYISKSLSIKSPDYKEIFYAYDSAYTASVLSQKYIDAENFITQSFKLARRYDLTEEIYGRLVAVTGFYQLAQLNNWPLQHSVSNKNIRSLIFPVSSVKYISKDSAILTVTAGSVEGLYAGLEVQCLGTKLPFLKDDRSSNVLGGGKITNVTENSATVLFRQTYTTDSSDNIYPNDVIFCDVNEVYKNDLGDYQVLADKDISFLNNYREQPYHIRQLAYCDIPGQQNLLDTFFLNAVKEIAEMLQGNIALENTFTKNIPSGFFKSMSLTQALLKTNIPHLRAFLKFVKLYPGKYIGQKFKFSEVYATWVINGTPLDDYGLLELLKEYKGTPFYNECLIAYEGSIVKDKQWLGWKDELLDSLDNGAFPQQNWDVLQNTATYYHTTWMLAWNKLLSGRIAAFNKKTADATLLITEAKKQFEELKMNNEVQFAANTLTQVNNQRVAKIALQTNHSLPFSVAYSPDGKYFASYSDDYTIKLWDAKLVRQIQTITAHVNSINQVTFSANSKYLISASDDEFIRIWDTRSMRLYKEINTHYRVKYAVLNRTGDKIIAAGSDSCIHVYNFENGTEEKKLKIHKAIINTGDYNPDYQHLIYTGGSDSVSYITNIETGQWVRWFKNGGKIVSVKATDDRQYFAALSNDQQIKFWRQNGKYLGSLTTIKYKFGNSTTYPGFDINTRKKVFAFVNEKGLLSLGDIDSLNYYWYNLKFEGNILDLKFHPNGNYLLVTTSLDKLYLVNITQYHLVHGSNIQSKIVGRDASIISSMSFSNDDNMLAYQSGSTYVMDLSTGKNIGFGIEGSSQLRTSIYFTHNDSALSYVPLDARRLIEKNLYSGDTLSQLITNRSDTLVSINVPYRGIAFNTRSQDGKLTAIWFNKESISIYETATEKLLYKIPLDTNQTELLTAMFIPGTDKFVAFNDVNNSVSFYKLNAPVLKPFYRYTAPQEFEFGMGCYDPLHNQILAASQSNNVYFFDAVAGKLKDTINFNFIDKQEGVNTIALHPDGHTLFVGMNNLMLVYDIGTKKVINNFNGANYTIGQAQFSHDGKTLAAGSFTGIIHLFDTKEYKKLLQVQTYADREPVWITPDNYYIASRASLQDLYFTYNHTLYPFDQFDINFNRPDTVLERLGRIDQPLLNAYKEAWTKRFKKSGISADRLRPDFKVPELNILNAEEIPAFVNTSPVVPLRIQMKDDNAKIASYNLWINGIPLYGKEGKKLQQPLSKIIVNDSVRLSGVNNVIQVACKNDNGVESLKEKFEIKNYVTDTAYFKTYLFCVSVSEYKDKKYSLKYARKDGRDLVNAFKKEFGENIYIDTLFDEKATLKNILAWKKIMQKTAIKDRVILYVSGHGLLDKNYDFYYATYDVDFKNPADKGLAYDEIEKLLDKIPARKKLLLMDACHSGEVDKESVAEKVSQNSVAASDVKKVNVVFKSKGAGEDISNSKLGLNNSFELMQDLFTNLNNGNGTAVISAAAGNSYAYESDVWNNGIFTYCILHGLKDKAADINHDQRISVAELQKFVSSEVMRLTQGAQKPTARQENLDNDWLVW